MNPLVGAIRGTLYRSGHCILLRQGDTALVPVWPRGTQINDAGVALPPANGGTLLRFDDLAYLFGTRAAAAPNQSACGAEAFVVTRADTQRRLLASSPRPSYTSGLLVRRGQCLVIENVEGTLLPVWPAGTQISATQVITPNLRGHTPLAIGDRASITGRYVYADEGGLQRLVGAQAECAKRGMIVETANRLYLGDTPIEVARYSDAVLILKIDAANTADLRQDTFRTTVHATVVEAFKGPYRAGDKLRLRYGPGQGGPFVAHTPYLPQPGDVALTFIHQDQYRQQAEAHGGRPVPGFVAASGGMYKIEAGRIVNHGGLLLPETLAELRRQLKR